MSAASSIQTGDVLLIPSPSLLDQPKPGVTPLKEATIKWSQSRVEQTDVYYTGLVQVKNTGASGAPPRTVLIFIQKKYYELIKGSSGSLDPKHITKSSAAKAAGDYYELTLGSPLQYGQKNSKGEGRFVVYHEPEREIFQHRFSRAAIETLILGPIAKDVGIALGYYPERDTGANGLITEMLKGVDGLSKLIGDKLHSF
ncbi:hypothetical protein FRC11_014985 [Ceratobasidium sp. 423]|nr:hypothetical protein FRC11_014985 [Ceratobasidium sp. 423]